MRKPPRWLSELAWRFLDNRMDWHARQAVRHARLHGQWRRAVRAAVEMRRSGDE